MHSFVCVVVVVVALFTISMLLLIVDNKFDCGDDDGDLTEPVAAVVGVLWFYC